MRKSGLPIPSYVPPMVREVIEHRRKDNPQYGLLQLAEDCQLSYSVVVKFFKEYDHEHLFRFRNFCEAVKTDDRHTIDDYVGYLGYPEDTRRAIFDKLIRARYQSYTQCAIACGVSEHYLTDLLAGKSAQKILKTYAPLADGLGTTLEQLATIIGDFKQH